MTTAPVYKLNGFVADGFEAVAQAFIDNFIERDELGGACCIYVQGKPIVDMWAGVADVSSGQPWAQSTVVPIFSATKGALFATVHLLVQRGQLDLDATVASYWPEFAARGKERITLRWVLSHQAGIPAIDADIALSELADWSTMVAAVARQTPSWSPGSAHGYHPRSIGWILGELIRRVTGRSFAHYFRDEIASPFKLNFNVGTDPARTPLLARLQAPPRSDLEASVGELPAAAENLRHRALSGPSDLFAYDERWNTQEYLLPEMPSSNGVATARSLARLYASMIGPVDGRRLLDPKTIDTARTVQVDGYDRVLGRRSTFGLGFSIYPGLGNGCPPGTFGHPGAGGSIGFGDPSRDLAFGYITNKMRLGMHETDRATALIDALYRSI